jgi:cytochrome c553
MLQSRRLLVLVGVPILMGTTTLRAADSGIEFSDTLEQRLIACAACHGKQGEGIRANEYYPRIAGKPADYLYRQLASFRDGRRTYPLMVYFVRYSSDEYLREIATYYSKLQPPFSTSIPPSATKDVLARGEALVQKGDPAKGIPSCVACHGTTLTGMLPGIPGLVGLDPNYVSAQIGSWQRGSRHADEPDCMAKIAAKLSGPDTSAITAYLATQPGVASMGPMPDTKQKLPMACGSEPR